ncbi:MAG: hypothetical protein R3C45_06945 [Phycisphaerales bacterium]
MINALRERFRYVMTRGLCWRCLRCRTRSVWKSIAGVVDPSWQIVIEDEALVTSSQPKARPIILVMGTDGRVIARIGGRSRWHRSWRLTWISLGLRKRWWFRLNQSSQTSSAAMAGSTPSSTTAWPGNSTSKVLRKAEQTLLEGIELYPRDDKLYGELIIL